MKTLNNELIELLKLQWKGQDMVDHCYKNTEYIKHDGKYIAIGDKKPSITKTLWFDDEKEIPSVNEEMFIEQNMRTNAPKPMKMESIHYDKLTIIAEYDNDKTGFRLCGLTYTEGGKYQNEMEVTEELLQKINKIKAEMAIKYEKRLRSYWKRYNKNVRFRGYWVNR